MYYSDETLYLLFGSLQDGLIGGWFVFLVVWASRPAARFFETWGRTTRLGLATCVTLLALAFLTAFIEWGDAPWNLILFPVALLAFASPAQGPFVLRLVWLYFLWFTLEKAHFLPVDWGGWGSLETFRFVFFEYGQALLHPFCYLTAEFEIPLVHDWLESALDLASDNARFVLLPTASAAAVGILQTMERRLGGSRAEVRQGETRADRRLLRGVLLLFLPISVAFFGVPDHRGFLDGPSWEWLVLVLPVFIAEVLPSRWVFGRRWRVVALLSAIFGTICLLAPSQARMTNVGVAALLLSLGVPLWRGIRLLFVSRDGGLRVPLAAGSILLWFVALPVSVAYALVGVVDCVFDLHGLRPPPTLAPRPPVPRRVLLWGTLLTVPTLLWAAVVLGVSFVTVQDGRLAQLPEPTEILHKDWGDPWATSERVCEERGRRPCTTSEISVRADNDQDEDRHDIYAHQDPPAFIAYPDEDGLGRAFSELGGWFPAWWDSSWRGIGTRPQQFVWPDGVPLRPHVANGELWIYCCPISQRPLTSDGEAAP